ncbi:hypothetical protein N5O88_10180 [Pseudomonas sp. GD03721]|nr:MULTISPECIES: hypothetical protein [unclassified Pseudomonas]MDH1440367.1 hypothetical protein [Pseudomonas sp. GD03722]WGG03543.1 hypothetical protein N5O88_10180 [Pseudomonas sp. GD03721]WGG07711.1 hypothetical protein N5O87_10190 [Pseudomonas sp. GD03919]
MSKHTFTVAERDTPRPDVHYVAIPVEHLTELRMAAIGAEQLLAQRLGSTDAMATRTTLNNALALTGDPYVIQLETD